jgi:hypothetical protein
MDEIWAFVGKKEKRVRVDDNPELGGDQYVFVAMDSETKLIPSFGIGQAHCSEYLVLRSQLAGLPCKSRTRSDVRLAVLCVQRVILDSEVRKSLHFFVTTFWSPSLYLRCR